MLPANYLTATETITLIKDGETTARQVIQDHCDQIDERDGVVRAWVTTNFEIAFRDAELTKGLPLHGVVVGVKDIIGTFALIPCEVY
jgi:Asp-tRNA(Asn)/Glu-tRNA(Gln) amidotransferase A subunit family amidase